MADTEARGVAQAQRQDVSIPGLGYAPAPGVAARAVPIALPGTPAPDTSAAQSLLHALDVSTGNLDAFGQTFLKEDRDDNFKKGQMAQQDSQKDFATAQASGVIPQAANPWFIKGYQNQDGRVQGLDYYNAMTSAYANSPAKGNDDPAAYDKFLKDFKTGYAAKLPADRSTDWWSGFQQTSGVADERMGQEHANDVHQAVLEKQAVNTGAEVNTILNSTNDPKVAAAGIDQLRAKMRLDGMAPGDFDKVASTQILAKGKMGDPAMLAVLDYVKTGDVKPVGQDNYNAANKDLKMTPQEQSLYQRHLTNLNGPGGVDNKDGSRSSLYNLTIEEGGKTYVVPSVYDGKILKPDDAIARAKEQGLDKFPSYGSEKEADARYDAMHAYMNKDTDAYFGNKQSGTGATLASDAKIAMARVDVQQYLTDKSRSAQEFAWAADNHAYTINVVRPRADQAYQHEQATWSREAASWSREDQSRSLITQIQTKTIASPETAIADTRPLLTKLSEVNPLAVESTRGFVQSYIGGTDTVAAATEAPVAAGFRDRIIHAAGNPAEQQALMLDINNAVKNKTLNKGTYNELFIFSEHMKDFDPEQVRKINSPEMNDLKNTAKARLMNPTNNVMGNLFGGAAGDYNTLVDAINNSALDYLKKNPAATSQELRENAEKVMNGLLPSLLQGYSDKNKGQLEQLGTQAEHAASAPGRTSLPMPVKPRPNDPPPTELQKSLVKLHPADKMALVREAAQAHQKGPQAFSEFLMQNDQQFGVPGITAAIIGEANARATAPPLKRP